MKEKIFSINLRKLKDGQYVEFVQMKTPIFTAHAKALKLEVLLGGYRSLRKYL